MVGPNGAESSSGTNPLIIWQQPHLIFFAELDYRFHPSRATLEKWDKIVEDTAEFLMFFATLNPATGKYDLSLRSKPYLKSLLPGDGVDPTVMKATVEKVVSTWHWNHTWGWDFLMVAIAAARNGDPKLAVDMLFNSSHANNFLANGCSNGGPFPYFPSNGGLLYAIALMAAGWDGGPNRPAPGFPDDGTWHVQFENLIKAP